MSLAHQRHRPQPPAHLPSPSLDADATTSAPAFADGANEASLLSDSGEVETPILDGLGLGDGPSAAGELPSWGFDEGAAEAGASAAGPGPSVDDEHDGAEAATAEAGASGAAPGVSVDDEHDRAEGAEPAAPTAVKAPEAPPPAAAPAAEAEGEAASEEGAAIEESGPQAEAGGEVALAAAAPDAALALLTEGGEAEVGTSGPAVAQRAVPTRATPSIADSLARADAPVAGLADGLESAFDGFTTVDATLEAGRLPAAPAFAPPPPNNAAVGWIEDAIPDVPSVADPAVAEHSEGGEMVMSVGPEPAFNLIDDLDPSHLADIGREGEDQYAAAADALWAAVVDGPGAEILGGVDLDVAIPVATPSLSGLEGGPLGEIDAAAGLDAAAPIAEALDGLLNGIGGDLDGPLGDAIAGAQDLQEQTVAAGWDTIQTAQQDALAYGQATLDGLLDKLRIDQHAAFDQLNEMVESGRLSITGMWDDAAGTAERMLADGELEADGIRAVFDGIIDRLPRIPFIRRVIRKIINRMVREVVGMFGRVQGAMNDVYDQARSGADDLIDGVQDFATSSFDTVRDTMEDDVGNFFTSTIPDIAGEVADTAANVADDVGSELADIGDTLVTTATDLADQAGDGLDAAVDFAGGVAGDALDFGSGVAGDALDFASDVGGDLLDGVGGAFGDLASLVPGDLDGLGLDALRDLAMAALDNLGGAPDWLVGVVMKKAIDTFGAATVLSKLSDDAVRSIAEAMQDSGIDLGLSDGGSTTAASASTAAPAATSAPATLAARGVAARGDAPAAAKLTIGEKYQAGRLPPGSTVTRLGRDGVTFAPDDGWVVVRFADRTTELVYQDTMVTLVKLPAGYATETETEPETATTDASTSPIDQTGVMEEALGPVGFAGVPLDFISREVMTPVIVGILGRSNTEDLVGFLHGCIAEVFSLFK